MIFIISVTLQNCLAENWMLEFPRC